MLEQKFLSRIEDRRRAIGGRSAIESAIARALSVDADEHAGEGFEDPASAVEDVVIARLELLRLRELIADLSRDQQLVLASQVWVDMGVSEFCAVYGWSLEKYRKVAQRARAKLRVLADEYESGERCARLEPEIVALAAAAGTDEALSRARAHIANCSGCARIARSLGVHPPAAVVPLLPVGLAGALAARLGGLWSAIRRSAAALRYPFTEAGASFGANGGVGAVKVGLAAVCVAGAAGGYAVCTHLGVLPALGGGTRPAVHATATPRLEDHRRLLASHPRHRVAVPRRPAPRSTPTVVATAATPRAHRHLSPVEQIRREFGTPPAHASAATAPQPATTSAAPASSVTSTRAAVQTRTEFGFER